MNRDSYTDRHLADILSKYIDHINRGAAPSIEEFLKEHADFADRLRPILQLANDFKAEISTASTPTEQRETAFQQIRNKFLSALEKNTLREQVEKNRAEIDINKRPDFLLLLLHSCGEIWGISKVVKLLFLMGKEGRCDRFVSDFYAHVAYNYGPFEQAIYKDIEALEQVGLIKEKKPPAKKITPEEDIEEGLYPEKVDSIYRLTPRGEKYTQALINAAQKKNPNILRAVKQIVNRYGHLPLRMLLEYIYKTYPEFSEKSKIRDEILGMEND